MPIRGSIRFCIRTDDPNMTPTTRCDVCQRLTSAWWLVINYYDIEAATLCGECLKATEHDDKGRPLDPKAYNHALVVIALTRDTTK